MDTEVFDCVEHWVGQLRSIDGEIKELNVKLGVLKARLKFARQRHRQKYIQWEILSLDHFDERVQVELFSCAPSRDDGSGTAVVTHNARAPPDTAASLSPKNEGRSPLQGDSAFRGKTRCALSSGSAPEIVRALCLRRFEWRTADESESTAECVQGVLPRGKYRVARLQAWRTLADRSAHWSVPGGVGTR